MHGIQNTFLRLLECSASAPTRSGSAQTAQTPAYRSRSGLTSSGLSAGIYEAPTA